MNEEYEEWLEAEKAEAWIEYQALYQEHGWYIMNSVGTVSPEDLNNFYTAAANFRTLERVLDEYRKRDSEETRQCLYNKIFYHKRYK